MSHGMSRTLHPGACYPLHGTKRLHHMHWTVGSAVSGGILGAARGYALAPFLGRDMSILGGLIPPGVESRAQCAWEST